MRVVARLTAALAWLAAAPAVAFAQEGSAPSGWETNFQQSATKVMDYLTWFGWYTLFIVSLVVMLVIGLLAWCVLKFNERSNPVPSRITHNTTIEVLWTVLPVLILVAIAIPSFRLLYAEYDPSKLYADFDPKTDKFMTVKVTGVQWSWNVDYSNDEDSVANGVAEPISLSMFIVDEASLAPGQLRNLSVDSPMVVPVDTFVRVQVTAEGDAIHSFAMPAFGIKVDAVPGRLNGTYFKAEREGTFYGQCSELCGKDHAFMPFNIMVVSKERFREWAAAAPNDLTAAYQKLAAGLESDKQQKQLAAVEDAGSQEMPRN
jgi:cytochrome c oxidase subunit 2